MIWLRSIMSFTKGHPVAASTRVIFVFNTADRKAIRVQREKQIVKMKAELTQIAASVSLGRRGTDHAAISKRIVCVFGSKDAAKFFQWELKPLTPDEKTALLTQQTTSGSKPIRGGSKVTHRFEWSFDEALMMATMHTSQYRGMLAPLLQNGNQSVTILLSRAGNLTERLAVVPH